MSTDNSDKFPVLTLPQGKIKGIERETIYQHTYYSFEGIPYAKPPLGELRFKAPEPADNWEDVKDCSSDFDIRPVQKNPITNTVNGSEDCLYLNVYTKTLNSEKPLPVMVWIYGGGFYMGEATRKLYSPDYFMRDDVILVTFNYRLCSLGFLKLSDPSLEIPGNAGLKDQLLALRWVKQFINHFNGDASNITLFGESAGGCSTHYMMATKKTKSLFNKAIAMSGTVMHNWSNMPQTDMAYRLAKYHGYEDENDDKLVLAYLRALEPHKLVDHTLLNEEERRNGYLFAFGPTVEAYETKDCIVPRSPMEMLKTTWTNEIPLMIGGTSFEGLLTYMRLKMFPQGMSVLRKDPERLLPQEVRESHTAEENKEYYERLIKAHFGEQKLDEKAMFKFLDYFSYKLFWHGFHRSVLSRLAYSCAPTYLYRFDFDSPDFNHYRTKFCGTDKVRGVAHADDLSYLFFSDDSWKVATDSAEYKTIERMVDMRVAFAKTGNPNCDALKPAEWQPLTPDDPYQALNISYEVTVMQLPEKEKLDVWDSLYKQSELY